MEPSRRMVACCDLRGNSRIWLVVGWKDYAAHPASCTCLLAPIRPLLPASIPAFVSAYEASVFPTPGLPFRLPLPRIPSAQHPHLKMPVQDRDTFHTKALILKQILDQHPDPDSVQTNAETVPRPTWRSPCRAELPPVTASS